jgi:hypothetical protein
VPLSTLSPRLLAAEWSFEVVCRDVVLSHPDLDGSLLDAVVVVMDHEVSVAGTFDILEHLLGFAIGGELGPFDSGWSRRRGRDVGEFGIHGAGGIVWRDR